MVAIVQINLVVADLERSREFYEQLGVDFLPRNRHGEGSAEAWVSVDIDTTLVLHSTEFALWWDESGPQPSPGGPQVDFKLDDTQHLDAVIANLEASGGTLLKSAADMPWGERFAIVGDPDGHRIGLKAPLDPTATEEE